MRLLMGIRERAEKACPWGIHYKDYKCNWCKTIINALTAQVKADAEIVKESCTCPPKLHEKRLVCEFCLCAQEILKQNKVDKYTTLSQSQHQP